MQHIRLRKIFQKSGKRFVMTKNKSLSKFAEDIAAVMPEVDANTEGQYGDGLGSEDEPQQLSLILDRLKQYDMWYEDVRREVSYPSNGGKCDVILPDGTPVECKLLRYWRANGDPEDYMPKTVLSPFHSNTLMTDAYEIHASEFNHRGGLLGLFYKRSEDDRQTVDNLPERYTPEDLADKIARDIEYWYDVNASVSNISKVKGLQHSVHKRGAAITWEIA